MFKFPAIEDIDPEEFELLVKSWAESASSKLERLEVTHHKAILGDDGEYTFDGIRLIIQADSDVDSTGLALLDEFSDCTAAYIKELFDGEIKVESIAQVPAGA